MRNLKLQNLQQDAEKAFLALTAYIKELDAREGDPNFAHARMLFEEGWRYWHNIDAGANDRRDRLYTLWNDEDWDEEERHEPRVVPSNSMSDGRVLAMLQLSESQSAVLKYLNDLTSEQCVSPTDNVVLKARGMVTNFGEE